MTPKQSVFLLPVFLGAVGLLISTMLLSVHNWRRENPSRAGRWSRMLIVGISRPSAYVMLGLSILLLTVGVLGAALA